MFYLFCTDHFHILPSLSQITLYFGDNCLAIHANDMYEKSYSYSGRSEPVVMLTMITSWWRHQMETFSALLAICAVSSPVTGELTAQRPVKRSFDGFFDLRLNKQLSKQSWGWWFGTPPRLLWRLCNDQRNSYIILFVCFHKPIKMTQTFDFMQTVRCFSWQNLKCI